MFQKKRIISALLKILIFFKLEISDQVLIEIINAIVIKNNNNYH